MRIHLKYLALISLLSITFDLAKAQDYKANDLNNFNLKGNVKKMEILYLDSNDSLIFDNNLTHFNSITFNHFGFLTSSVKMNTPKDTIRKNSYIFNSKNQLVEVLKYEFGSLNEIREFQYNDKSLIDYQLIFDRNRESIEDSIHFTFDKKKNLLREYQYNHGRYNIFLNQYNKKNQRISSVYYSVHPRDPIWVWKWTYEDNKQTEYKFIYKEEDLREISIRVLSELVINLDKQKEDNADFEEYLDYVLLKKFFQNDILPNIKDRSREGGSSKWSSKFKTDPEFVKYYSKSEKVNKIVYPNEIVEFDYNKQEDIISQKNISDNRTDFTENKYLYDSYGNWVKKTEFKNNKEISRVIRKITYY